MHEWRFSYLLGVKSAFLRVTFVSQRKRRIWAKNASCNREGGERKKVDVRSWDRNRSIFSIAARLPATDSTCERLTLSLAPTQQAVAACYIECKTPCSCCGGHQFCGKTADPLQKSVFCTGRLWLIRRRANQYHWERCEKMRAKVSSHARDSGWKIEFFCHTWHFWSHIYTGLLLPATPQR